MEVIIGVLIGAGIGYIAAITTLVVEHRRWRKEFKLQYLITERIRREKQCDRIKELMEGVLREGLLPLELIMVIGARLPLKIEILMKKAFRDRDLSQPKAKRELYEEVSIILGAYLHEIDEQIEELTQ